MLEDIRLTGEEIITNREKHIDPNFNVLPVGVSKLERIAADFATDKALRKIIEHLQPEIRRSFNATCYDCMEALKKLK